MRTPIGFLVLALALANGASALAADLPDSTAADREKVAVTVYNVNLALVRETRRLNLPAGGTGKLRFMDVPAQINPRTVHLESLTAPGDLSVIEQNYEYDLISPQKLMEKYVGRDVEIVEQAPDLSTRTVRAKLLSMNGGPVYQVEDRILLNQGGKVSLPSLPADLVARPTLVWTLAAAKSGKHEIEASYLTDGMNWSADYVALVSTDDKTTGWNGWVTIDNHSGATFEDATLKLVAGDVRRVTAPMNQAYDRMEMSAKAAGAPQFQEEGFFEYHLYTLERPSTIKDNQTKQIALLEGSNIPVTKRLLLTGQPYWYRGQFGTLTQNEKVSVTLELTNSQKDGLGMPLPKGTVRVYKKDASGAAQFVGEDSIDHTPKDETIRLKVGDAFDVVADRTQTDYRVLSPHEIESAYEVSLRNRKEEDVTVTVREPVGGDWKLLSSSIPGTKKDAGTLEFQVPVPKGAEVKLSYRVRVRF